MHPSRVEDWGEVPYPEALERMRGYVGRRIKEEIEDRLVLCSHPPVFTVGRRLGAEKHILEAKEIPVVEVERGGDVTYHGPGQLVVYPIFLLREGERDLHRHLRNVEELVIQTLQVFSLEGDRSGPTGVWVKGKKIASIGIAARRWVVFHGVALNVSVDLSTFFQIEPCGLDPKMMTSMEQELGQPVELSLVKEALLTCTEKIFGRSLTTF